MQWLFPDIDRYLPGVHSRQAVDVWFSEKVPAGHEMQSDSELRPDTVENLPALQGLQFDSAVIPVPD